jgi:hypothetical protein
VAKLQQEATTGSLFEQIGDKITSKTLLTSPFLPRIIIPSPPTRTKPSSKALPQFPPTQRNCVGRFHDPSTDQPVLTANQRPPILGQSSLRKSIAGLRPFNPFLAIVDFSIHSSSKILSRPSTIQNLLRMHRSERSYCMARRFTAL